MIDFYEFSSNDASARILLSNDNIIFPCEIRNDELIQRFARSSVLFNVKWFPLFTNHIYSLVRFLQGKLN
jgi:hypothetical protein